MCFRFGKGEPRDRHRRCTSSHLAASRSALAGRADATAHLRSLRADPARLSDRRISRTTSPATASSSRSMCRPIGRKSSSRTRRPGCSALPRKPAGRMRLSPTRISAWTTFARSSTGSRATSWCVACACNCTGTRTRCTALPRAPICARIRPSAATSRGWPTMAGVSICRCLRRRCRMPPASPKPARSHLCAAACRNAGRPVACRPRGLARRHGAAGGVSEHCLQALGAWHLHSSQRPCAHRRDRCRCTGDLRTRSLPVRLEFSDRETVDQLSRVWSTPISTPSNRTRVIATRSCATRRCGSIVSRRSLARGKQTKEMGGNIWHWKSKFSTMGTSSWN